MVMVFVRKMANFVYLPQHGIQPTCSFTAATTQIMATERTQKKTISYNLYNIRLLEAFFFFMFVKVSIEFNIWGKFLPIWFCPFCFERLSKYCERSKVLWTIKRQKKQMVGLFEENPWFLIFIFWPCFVCCKSNLHPCGKWEWITSIQALMAYLPQGLNKSALEKKID